MKRGEQTRLWCHEPPGMFPSLAVGSEWVAWLQLQGGQGKEIAQLPPPHPPGSCLPEGASCQGSTAWESRPPLEA